MDGGLANLAYMDIFYFIKILWQRKWMLIFVSLSAVFLTFFLVGLLKPTFKSNAILATGITVRKNIKLNNEDPFVQKYEIVSAFSNLMTTMTSRTSLRLLSYRLLLHDLSDSIAVKPFRALEPFPEYSVSDEAKETFVAFLLVHRDSLWAIQLDQSQNAVFNQLVKAMGYDYESLKENLNIYRMEETDYLKVEFKSEDPRLCEFAVNQFCHEFLKYNFQRVNQDEGEAVNFYRQLSIDKRKQLNRLDNELNALKEAKKIVNLEEQTRAIVGQLNELEVAKEESRKLIPGLRKTIVLLDNYLTEYGLKSDALASQIKLINEGLVDVVDEIKAIKVGALDEEVESLIERGGYTPSSTVNLSAPEESARDVLIDQFIKQLRNNQVDLDETLVSILGQRIQAEVDLALAEEGVKSLESKIESLKLGSMDLISVEAQINILEGQREMALQEYLQVSGRLNDAEVIAQSSLYPITFFEYAQVPEEPEPSKRLLYSAFAGAGAGGVFTVVLFLLILFDNTLSSPSQFEKLIPAKLMGALVRIPNRKFNFDRIFDPISRDNLIINYVESLRRIRQKMETSKAKCFLITSTDNLADRSATILSIAHSLDRKNKSVLILDTNFKRNMLSNLESKEWPNNPLMHENQVPRKPKLSKRLRRVDLTNTNIEVIGNYQSQESPSEILGEGVFEHFLDQLAPNYDYLLMEAPGLNEYADARELIDYAEKVIVVFEAKSVYKEVDRESLEFLSGLGDRFLGCILQGVESKNLS